MKPMLKSFLRIPLWSYILVFSVISVNTVYLVYRYRFPISGETESFKNGFWIIDYIDPEGPVGRTTIKTGDTIVSCNGYTLEEWFLVSHGQKAGDTLIFGILRNHNEVGIPVIPDSAMSIFPFFFWSTYVMIILFSTGSLYLLYKRPGNNIVMLFFVYLQLSAITSNAGYNVSADPPALIASSVFILCGCLYGPALIHFHLVFPQKSSLLSKFKALPAIFYVIGAILALSMITSYVISFWYPLSALSRMFQYFHIFSLYWITASFFIAFLIVLYQLVTIRNSLARNQLLLMFFGSLFVFITPGTVALFNDWANEIKFPFIIEIAQGIGSLVMILCMLTAIFHYRIWDVEFFIRKALLYLSATLVITLSYFIMIWIVDRILLRESRLVRFLILAVSIIVFLILRDRIQRMIDLLFHRETYDFATVVSDFEVKLLGVYRFEEIKEKIVRGLDEIFHFKTFVFTLRKYDLIYEPAFVHGIDLGKIGQQFEITEEFEEKLYRSKVFSPQELKGKYPLVELSKGELIIPMASNDQLKGFFICGPKKSERNYSLQDIRVLSLIAQRVIAMLHTASLYQKEIERQIMLECERARISQDIHDDVGASLTRIFIMSEVARKDPGSSIQTRQWLEQISETSRGVMEEMSQIIWALNPKNDTLEGLIAHIRRFANEYTEPTSVKVYFDLPDVLPPILMTTEVRRNVYLVVREALHNVIKHSGATMVEIAAGLHLQAFSIIVRDNGMGFDYEKLKFAGNGLSSMKKRMQEIGGELSIKSNAGKGTEVIIKHLSWHPSTTC